jgi:hypothetical protein
VNCAYLEPLLNYSLRGSRAADLASVYTRNECRLRVAAYCVGAGANTGPKYRSESSNYAAGAAAIDKRILGMGLWSCYSNERNVRREYIFAVFCLYRQRCFLTAIVQVSKDMKQDWTRAVGRCLDGWLANSSSAASMVGTQRFKPPHPQPSTKNAMRCSGCTIRLSHGMMLLATLMGWHLSHT